MAPVSCPLCGAIMPAELTVCDSCVRITGRLAPGRYLVPGRSGGRWVIVTRENAARWDAERVARMTQAGTIAPTDPAVEPGAYVVLTNPGSKPEVFRFAYLPVRDCGDCHGSGRSYWSGDGRSVCPSCGGARQVPPDLGMVRAGFELPAGGRWATAEEVELPAVVGGIRTHRGGDR